VGNFTVDYGAIFYAKGANITKAKEVAMPYKTTEELPDSVKNSLPSHAQDIYKEAFNNAWEQYKDPHERRDDASREEVAHRVAWSAVKEKYEKDADGHWHTKE
jgi:cation transport regulator